MGNNKLQSVVLTIKGKDENWLDVEHTTDPE